MIHSPRLADRSRRAALAGLLVLWAVGCAGCKAIIPSNDRVWAKDQARLPAIDIADQQVLVHNVRHCEYRSSDNYQPRWHDKQYDLDQLKSVDFIVMPFQGSQSLAHTMLSFGFDDQEYLDVSVEIRKEAGERYSTIAGFFNQYEIMYVLSDERDSIGTTANQLLRDVYIYRTIANPAQAKALFLDVAQRVNKLNSQPEFYNTVTNNCTTNLLAHVNDIATQKIPYSHQILFPGLADRLAYDRGLLVAQGSFEQTKLAARVNEKAYVFRDQPDFAVQIRR